ncbi:MAG: alpha,2-mannosyltransferase [Rubrobacteraceae bacterium]|nr:alpha,2-mannosyltransferase [Rubrobacteraceae bacterium]
MFLVAVAFGTLVLSLGIYARSGFGALAGISSDSMVVHMDFNVFWHSAKALLEGRNLYYDTGGPDSSANPPLWTLIISPFALLEPLTAYRLFVSITVLTSVAYLAWMADELRLRAGWVAIGVGMLLLSSPLLGTLALGQMYPLLALGLVAAWVADRKGRLTLSGVALGLVVAVKPQLAPVILWPLVRRRWRMLGATLASGAAATLAAIVVAGPGSLLDWLSYVGKRRPDGYWDNNTLPGAAVRLFSENDFVNPIATLSWMVPVAYILGAGIVILTAIRVRRGSEAGLWALVAASLLASPIAWHNYLVLLGPGILLLLARGRVAPALLLFALQSIPPDWSLLWRYGDTVVAALALTLCLYILIAHWLAFLTDEAVAKESTASGTVRSAPGE